MPRNHLISEQLASADMCMGDLRLAVEASIRYRRLLAELLDRIGAPDTCHCGAAILWVRHRGGRVAAPYNPDGSLHATTCPKIQSNSNQEREAIHA